ncbi:MAG: hypothetical protein M1818_004597 [Claussenomyces sp. TS43310]|nr:MAG: hypothetical protein M1818_004597 [Claussenomyces sp. TS43310]
MDRGEGIVRWSPNADRDEFLSINGINVGYPTITLYKAKGRAIPGQFDYSVVAKHNEYPTLTAYDWSPRVRGLVALGTKGGEVHLLRVDDGSNASMVLPLKLQRPCQAVAFNTTGLLAVGLDRVRNDQCLQIWDINQRLSHWDPSRPGWQTPPSPTDPLFKLEPSVAISSVRFFEDQPQTLVVGVKNQSVRIHDLRDPHGAVITFQTRCNNNLAIDHADPNYFVSSALDHPGLLVWDRRATSRQAASPMYLESVDASDVPWGCVLKLNRVIDPGRDSYIRGLRYCRDQRGLLGVMSNSGELQILQLRKEYIEPVPEIPVQDSPELLEVRRSYDIKYPYFHQSSPSKPEDRVVSFDWMTFGSNEIQPRLVTRNYDQKLAVELLPLRVQHALFGFLNISSNAGKTDSLAMPRFNDAREAISVYGPMAAALDGCNINFADNTRVDLKEHAMLVESDSPTSNTSALLSSLAEKLYKNLSLMRVRNSCGSSDLSRDSAKRADSIQVQCPTNPLSSREVHEKAHWAGVEAATRKQIYGVLTQKMNRRIRARYLFNPVKNQDIVADDPWLQNLWSWVENGEATARNNGMVADSLDLAYMGISTVWNIDLGSEPQTRLVETTELPTASQWSDAIELINKRAKRLKFKGVKTDRPQYRQLCLGICGCGKTTEELERELEAYEAKGHHTQAAIRALSEKDIQLAVEILQRGGKHLVFVALALSLQTKGTAAFDNSNSDEIIKQHPQMASDPYLRAIYAFISTGNWKALADEDSLPLPVRAGIALRNLDDRELTEWLAREEALAIKTGDIEGIVLTGITDKMVDIFCGYIEKFGDYQTAILVMSFGCPRYFKDYRVTQWRNAYKLHHDEHKLHIPRCHFEVGSTLLSRDRDGSTSIKPPPRQVTLRCVHCDAASTNDLVNTANPPLPLPPPSSSSDAVATTSSSSQQVPGHDPEARNPLIWSGVNAGISCPRCGRHLPRCAICLVTLGMPRVDRQQQAGTATATKESQLAHFMSFCMKCDHASHMGCSERWFAIQNECPVADCRCGCNDDNQRLRRENEAARVTWERLESGEKV